MADKRKMAVAIETYWPHDLRKLTLTRAQELSKTMQIRWLNVDLFDAGADVLPAAELVLVPDPKIVKKCEPIIAAYKKAKIRLEIVKAAPAKGAK